jgi:hypothetical protein
MPVPISPKLTKYMELIKIIKEKIIIRKDALITANNIMKSVKSIYNNLNFFEEVEIAKKLFLQNPLKYNKKKIIIII